MTMLVSVLATTVSFAQVGVNTITPDPSSALDVVSTEAGFLPPRMRTVERDAIANPAKGLMIFNTDANCTEVYIGYWRSLCAFNEAVAGELYSPATGLIWMDKNLGASQVATSSTDAASYGDLYQWGRAAEGHQ